MQKKFSYKEIAYLLSCYIIVADREINEYEVNALDNFFPCKKNDEIFKRRKEIFSDDEKRIQYKDLISALKLLNFNKSEKIEIVRVVIQIAFADDFVSTNEKEIIEDISRVVGLDYVELFNEEKYKSESRIKGAELSTIERFIGNIETTLYDALSNYSKEKTINLLLGSLAYSVSVENISKTAIVDLDRVSTIIINVNNRISQTLKELSNNSVISNNNSKEVQDVAKVIESTKWHFRDFLNISLAENIEILEKKKRNIRYFTIAFMGRTKAGKSTFHKVITQQENDDIGIGQLRTTRYNRSWYWEKLRIVDTPGIGAPNGEVDTEIAKSIIDEADIICYVVISDSIQETEFNFLETIKERNKPLYIILNVKSNLSQETRLKKFLENPNAWKECDGPQSISGHIQRIHDNLDGKYNLDAVEIIPIHLLAAQLGLSKDYNAITSKKLTKGSNIMQFVKSIKKEVHNTGSLKKSLSIIDGTAFQIHSICSIIETDVLKLDKSIESLSEKQMKFKLFVDSESVRLQNDIITIFVAAQSELHNRAASFASEHYDDKNAGRQWQNDEVAKSIYTRLGNKLENRMQDFNDKSKSQIEEIASDIQFCFMSPTCDSNIHGDSIVNTRLGVGVIGSILCAVAPFVITNIWNPGGWIVALGSLAVGLVVSIITSIFTSKAEKIRKSTERLKNQLIDNIDKSIEDNKKEALSNTNESVLTMYKVIDDILSTYISNAKLILKDLKKLITNCQSDEKVINSLIGFRILEFVGKTKEEEKAIDNMENEEIVSLFPVERNWEKQSIKYQYNTNLSKDEISKAQYATQMTIINK